MFPVARSTLSFGEIADYWSREIRPPASSNELLSILVSAWWLGELPGDSVHSHHQLLKLMFKSQYRDDLGIVFIVGDDAGPPQADLSPDESLEIDVRPQIRVPSSNTETWDEAANRDPFNALAKATEDFSIDLYKEFAVFLPSIKVTYEEFNTWLRSRGYSSPTFWHPDTGDRHLGSAVFLPSIKVTYEGFNTWPTSRGYSPPTVWHPHTADRHLGSVASQRSIKTWQAKPRKSLTASDSAVVKAINEIWPDGTMDQKARARNDRILKQLKTDSQHPVSPRTIQRTIKKIHFR